MDASKITFKLIDDAWRKEGIFPIKDHIAQMQTGLTKQELYTAFGKPHFSEGMFAVRQWDYIFKFKLADETKVCQYQIYFDENYKVANTFWDQPECMEYSGLEPKKTEPIKENSSIEIID